MLRAAEMDIDLGRVAKFYYVAEARSFIRAAEKLHVDQTWLSRQIQQLEAQLGCKLLERTTRHVELTAEGSELFEAARVLAKATNRARDLARVIEMRKNRELRLGIGNTTFWLPERENLLKIFRVRHPEMMMSTIVHGSLELIEALRERSIDIAITGMVQDRDEFEYVVIHRSRPFLFVPWENPLASKPRLKMADVIGLDMVIPLVENSYSFSAIYQPFIDAGAIPRWSAEGLLAAMHLAASKRICMIAWGYENIVSDSFVLREVEDCDAVIEVMAARNLNDERRSVRAFWATAHILTNGLPSL